MYWNILVNKTKVRRNQLSVGKTSQKETKPTKRLSEVGYSLAAKRQHHLPHLRHVNTLPTRNVELGIHLSMAYTHMGTPTGHTHTGKHSYGHNHRDTYTRAYTTWDFWTINSLPPQPSTVQYNLGPQQVTNSLGYNEVLLGRP